MKQNQKFNPKLIFLGTLLVVITFAFIFASGCINEDNTSINMADIIVEKMSNAESQGQILEIVSIPVPGNVVRPINEYVT